MKLEMSYLVKLENGTMAWLAIGKEIPEGAEIVEERPTLVANDGMAIKHKETGVIHEGAFWLQRHTIEEYEEIETPKEEPIEE